MHSRIVVLRILWLLGYCRIGGNNFSWKILKFIGQLISLESLRIQASGLEGPIPYNITLLESLTDLLRISDLRGRDTPIPPFSSTTCFKNLDFRFNKLNGSIPIGFVELNRTDSIYVSGSSYFDSTGSRWGFNNTGRFMDDDNCDSYIVDNTFKDRVADLAMDLSLLLTKDLAKPFGNRMVSSF
ncbi:putative leucine-rich repeat domain superfamily [Helianthus anomalus]